MRAIIGYTLLLFAFLFHSPCRPQEETVILDVPFVETPDEVVDMMLKMAGVDSSDLLYDLGCGNGKIVIAAAQKYGTRGVGIDLNPVRISESVQAAEEAGVTDKVRFYEQDIFEADFSQATVVTLYLLERVNRKLRPRILNELRPGTRVVSHDFNMGDWKPDSVESVHSDYDMHTLYLWIVPANIGGTWDIDAAAGLQFPIIVEQKYQEFSANAIMGQDSLAINKTHLRGNRIEFEFETEDGRSLRFAGTVSENRMKGTWRVNSPEINSGEWSALRRAGTSRPLGP